jgi:inner membrane protein
VFIIDPLYTLPLLAVVIWALFRKNWTRRFQAWMTAALVVSTGYLGLSVVLQRHVEQKAQDLFRQEGILPDKVFAIAAPFNILVWKVIGLQEDRYDNLYYSLLDEGGKPEIYTHPRHPELVACVEDTQAFRKLDWFSRGYYRAELDDGKLVISDLRMGMTPNYVFRFAIAEAQDDGFREIPPRSATGEVRVDPQDWTWLTARLKGVVAVRRAEAAVAGTGEAIAGQACALAGETSG